MKRTRLLLVFGLLSGIATAQPTDAELATECDKLLAHQFKPDGTGATAIISRNGLIVYHKAVGMSDREQGIAMETDDVFRIGSITKQFTAIAILQLMEQGRLNLQDEITRFIPDYPTQGYRITIEHLLTHTSGIQSYTGLPDYGTRMALDVSPEEMIAYFRNEPMRFAPGTSWDYSNSGYFLLGYIIEKVTGQSYCTYLEQVIFRPLGMTNTYCGTEKPIANRTVPYSMDEKGNFEKAEPISMTQPYAAGCIQSTVEDLYKWNEALRKGLLVRKETLDKAFTAYRLADGKATNYGYGWMLGSVQGSPSIEHGGGINGTLTMAIYLPKEDVFVAVFSNCDCNPPEDLAAKMAAIAIGKPYQQQEVTLKSKMLKQYVGSYENDKGELRIITLTDGKLYSQRGRNPKYLLKASGEDRFFFDDHLLTLAFSKNEKGKVDRLVSSGRNGDELWTRTDKTLTERKTISVPEAVLETYVGEYAVGPEFGFVVTREGSRLFVQATGQMRIEVFAETRTKFFMKEVDAELEFSAGGKGPVSEVVLKQGGRETVAKRVE
jgi:CubicO group peptidase (beta-lactamase class C family)